MNFQFLKSSRAFHVLRIFLNKVGFHEFWGNQVEIYLNILENWTFVYNMSHYQEWRNDGVGARTGKLFPLIHFRFCNEIQWHLLPWKKIKGKTLLICNHSNFLPKENSHHNRMPKSKFIFISLPSWCSLFPITFNVSRGGLVRKKIMIQWMSGGRAKLWLFFAFLWLRDLNYFLNFLFFILNECESQFMTNFIK